MFQKNKGEHMSRLIRDGNTSSSCHLNLEQSWTSKIQCLVTFQRQTRPCAEGRKRGKSKNGRHAAKKIWLGSAWVDWKRQLLFHQLKARHLGYVYSVIVYFNPHGIGYSSLNQHVVNILTLPETNIAPENKPSPKRIHLPTIDFQSRKC